MSHIVGFTFRFNRISNMTCDGLARFPPFGFCSEDFISSIKQVSKSNQLLKWVAMKVSRALTVVGHEDSHQEARRYNAAITEASYYI